MKKIFKIKKKTSRQKKTLTFLPDDLFKKAGKNSLNSP